MTMKTILIIDSDDFDRKILVEDMRRLGHTVFEAAHEHEALDHILGLGFASSLDYIIDFDLFIRGSVMDLVLKVASKKFLCPPEIISDNLALIEKFEMEKKPLDEQFSVPTAL